MTSKKLRFSSKNRRGLSSIVGGLLFVVLMVSTFAVLNLALNSQTNIALTSLDVANDGLKKQQENFEIDVYTDGANPANLTVDVTNKGQNPVEISTLVITEPQNAADNYPTQIIDIPVESSFITSGKTENIEEPLNLQLTLPLTGTKVYSFKVISSLGNSEIDTVVCDTSSCIPPVAPPGSGSLSSTLFVDGSNGVNTQNSSVIMLVTNTSDVPIKNITPNKGFTAPLCDDMWVNTEVVTPDIVSPETYSNCSVNPSPPLPPDEVELGAHQTTLFKWDGTINGDLGSTFTFCNSVTGDDGFGPVSSIETCDTLTIIDPNDCGGCDAGGGGETIILIDDLLIRPSIFMVIPSPFGASDKNDDQKGIWGINLANPTEKDMEISKVTIVAYPPGGQSQDNVFSGASGSNGCLEEDVQPLMGPAPAGYWDCPRDNILVWDGLDDPLTLPANSTRSFMVKVEPSGVKPGGTPANLDALIVQANVWSTFGSFGKSGYQSTMYLEKTSLVNVYLSNSTTSRDSILGYENDIPENSTRTYNAVLADMDTDATTTINSGARLIINIPREWEFIGFNGPISGFVDPPVVTLHSDGSYQIIATTNVPVGNGVNDAVGVSFDVKAPDVDYSRLYVMYLLADGTVTVGTEDKTIGPLNEIVLNVDP